MYSCICLFGIFTCSQLPFRQFNTKESSEVKKAFDIKNSLKKSILSVANDHFWISAVISISTLNASKYFVV